MILEKTDDEIREIFPKDTPERLGKWNLAPRVRKKDFVNG